MYLIDIQVKSIERKHFFNSLLEFLDFVSVLLFDVSCAPLMSMAVHASHNRNEGTQFRILVLFLVLHLYNILFTNNF